MESGVRLLRRILIFRNGRGGLNDSLIANAIVDRLLHHCHVVKIIGPSYLLKNIM